MIENVFDSHDHKLPKCRSHNLEFVSFWIFLDLLRPPYARRLMKNGNWIVGNTISDPLCRTRLGDRKLAKRVTPPTDHVLQRIGISLEEHSVGICPFFRDFLV